MGYGALIRKRVALIGAGYMGREYVKALSYSASLSPVGILGKSNARASLLAGEFSIPLVATSVSELYAKTHADAVIIAVPELAAQEIILEALAYPWTLLVEKPPGYRPEIAEELGVKAEAAGRSVFVALNRRFYSSTRAALDIIEGHSGRRCVVMQDQEDQCAALAAGQPREVVDAWMYANSIHVIDYATLFCRGEITRITTNGGLIPYRPSTIEASLSFSSGDTALYIGRWQMPGPWGVQVSADGIHLEMRPLEQVGFQKAGERRMTWLPRHRWDCTCKPGIIGLVEELGKALREEKHRLPTLGEGIQLMRLIEKMFAP